jgi:hypothetical protein
MRAIPSHMCALRSPGGQTQRARHAGVAPPKRTPLVAGGAGASNPSFTRLAPLPAPAADCPSRTAVGPLPPHWKRLSTPEGNAAVSAIDWRLDFS